MLPKLELSASNDELPDSFNSIIYQVINNNSAESYFHCLQSWNQVFSLIFKVPKLEKGELDNLINIIPK